MNGLNLSIKLLFLFLFPNIILLNIVKEMSFDFGVVQLLDNSIVRIEVISNVIIDYKECELLNNAIGELNNNSKSLVLMLADDTSQFTAEARAFSASDEGRKFTIADAMVTRNLAQRLIATLYIKINKPQIPSKIFNSEDEAIKWLLAQK